jgi:hypothetical protein
MLILGCSSGTTGSADAAPESTSTLITSVRLDDREGVYSAASLPEEAVSAPGPIISFVPGVVPIAGALGIAEPGQDLDIEIISLTEAREIRLATLNGTGHFSIDALGKGVATAGAYRYELTIKVADLGHAAQLGQAQECGAFNGIKTNILGIDTTISGSAIGFLCFFGFLSCEPVKCPPVKQLGPYCSREGGNPAFSYTGEGAEFLGWWRVTLYSERDSGVWYSFIQIRQPPDPDAFPEAVVVGSTVSDQFAWGDGTFDLTFDNGIAATRLDGVLDAAVRCEAGDVGDLHLATGRWVSSLNGPHLTIGLDPDYGTFVAEWIGTYLFR